MNRMNKRMNDLEIVFLEIEPTKARPFYFVAWFRHPSDPVDTFTELEMNLEFLDRENKVIEILISHY